MSQYISSLTAIISWATEEVELYYPRMDYSEFSEIVQASNHVHKLVFDGLTLLKSGTIDFGKNIDYKIKQLSLQNTGDEEYSDWRQNNN